jgi:chromosome partitioning protein
MVNISYSAFIIAFISQKGGVGKSFLSRAVAREAAAGGLNTKIADLDVQQATSVNWVRRRLMSGVEPRISAEPFATAKQAIGEASKYDLLIIDAPARASAGTLEIARVADLVVQPTGTSLDDCEPAVKEFHALVKEGIPKEKLVFVLNHVATEAEEFEARGYLTKAGYTVLEGSLMERPAYRIALNKGLSITETGFRTLNSGADAVIQQLIDKIGGEDGGHDEATAATEQLGRAAAS